MPIAFKNLNKKDVRLLKTCAFYVPSIGDSVEVEVVIGGVIVEGNSVAHPTWELLQLGQMASAWYSQEAKSQQFKSA